MNERDETPTPEDLRLDRYLLALERLAPEPGFEDRVMTRWRQIAPAPVRVRRLAAVARPSRLWWAAGLAAASSTGWLIALGNWVAGAGLQTLGTAFRTVFLFPALATLLDLSTVIGRSLSTYASAAYGAMGNGLYGIVAAMMFLPVLSGAGLFLTMRRPSGKRIATYAAR